MGKSSGGIRVLAETGVSYNETPSQKIAGVIADIHKEGHSKSQPFSIGEIEDRMNVYAAANNIELSSKEIYMGPKSISHALRKKKAEKGLTVNETDLIAFPERRKTMDLYYDGSAFIYTDYKAKYIVNPKYAMKINKEKTEYVAFVTAGKTDGKEFNGKRYKKL